MGLAFFDELQLPDVPGLPKMRDACGPSGSATSCAPPSARGFRSRAAALHPRHPRDAAEGPVEDDLQRRADAGRDADEQAPRAEALFVGPTQAIADNAYDKAVGMIEASPDLKRRFRPRDHIKTIEDLVNHSELKVKTFDVNILTGSILIFALLDELHLLGRNPHTTKVLRQIRGGLEKTPEGLLLITTTQSDDIPAGAFKDELTWRARSATATSAARSSGRCCRSSTSFPEDIAKDQGRGRTRPTGRW
jgi:hypothetical protein